MKRKEWNIGIRTLMIGAVAVIGSALMFLLTYVFPLEHGSAIFSILFTLAIIFLGLAVPYLMLKGLFSMAHKQNPAEKEISLSDIPKDKEQLGRTL